ncbi:MAG: PIG-L family deacetylase [Anaerolineales bacterium]|nr:PIG-L family deacetylase [Anaerolineales bacterium]
MRFHLDTAEIFVPDGLPADAALERTTHLGVGAHQDDLEIMALHGILECFQREDRWFSGVVVTDGSGSPRDGAYRDYTDEQMRSVRRTEQTKAAVVGEYAAQVLLDHPSGAVKDPAGLGVVEDLRRVLAASLPQIVYTHNLADKHDTHVAVALRVVEALRGLKPVERPQRLYGCEVWRDLDWLSDSEKVAFDVSPHENLQAALLGVFDSQIAGGKRYDLATLGRRRANATYHASHGVDLTTGTIFAMDLTPLIVNPDLRPGDFIQHFIDGFRKEIGDRLLRLGDPPR